ncbi:hypothetical protein [Nocardia salmonicida]
MSRATSIGLTASKILCVNELRFVRLEPDAVELIGELESIDRKIKAADKELRQLVTDRDSTLSRTFMRYLFPTQGKQSAAWFRRT